MGTIIHDVIVVTSWDEKALKLAHSFCVGKAATFSAFPHADNWSQIVSPIIPGLVNGYATFIVAPDGSKEGWDTSDSGDGLRTAIVAELKKFRFDDGSSPLDWIHVRFGDDMGSGDDAVVVQNHEWRDQ